MICYHVSTADLSAGDLLKPYAAGDDNYRDIRDFPHIQSRLGSIYAADDVATALRFNARYRDNKGIIYKCQILEPSRVARLDMALLDIPSSTPVWFCPHNLTAGMKLYWSGQCSSMPLQELIVAGQVRVLEALDIPAQNIPVD